jgi:1,4-alpha-glucan branching enzyme
MLNKRFFKTNDDCEVTFEIDAGDAQEVALVTDFHDWQPLPMSKAKKTGSPFRVKVRLPKEGEFQFRYFVDNSQWINDPGADAYWTNEYGESNCVVKTFSD